MITEANFNFKKNNFLFFCSLIIMVTACKEPKKINVYKKPSFDSIGKMSYEKAVLLYGKPVSTEVFDNANEDEVFPGIRAGIAKYYKAGVKVKIKEAIWLKKDSLYIAIWYTKKQNDWLPFDSYEYNEGVDF
jgi:hypothetical protein